VTGQHYLEADTGPTVSSKNCVTSLRPTAGNAPAPDEDYVALGLVHMEDPLAAASAR
jgi:hypothetical protein